MAKPIIMKIYPFDGRNACEIELQWTGARAYSNRLILSDSKTNHVVYDNTVSGFTLKHTIPAGTLTNGGKWAAQAQVYDQEGTASALSDKVLFYTLDTPQFFFRDENGKLEDGIKVEHSSYQSAIYYQSNDLEDLDSYVFYLYDNTDRLLLESDRLSDPRHITYTYKGLENNTEYYIRCKAVTVKGMLLDTGKIRIYVRYANPAQYSRIYADVLADRGCVQVGSNIIVIQYNGKEIFDYINGMIDLTEKTLYYDEGFSIDGDFSVQLCGYNLFQNAELLKLSNHHFALSLTSRVYHDGALRFRLMVPNGLSNYLIYSSPVLFQNTDLVTILIRRVNHVYGIYVRVGDPVYTDGDYWYGAGKPYDIKKRDVWIVTDEMDTYMVDKDTMNIYYTYDKPVLPEKGDIWL